MPLMIDGGRIPARWAEKQDWRGDYCSTPPTRGRSVSKLRSLTICRTRLLKTPSCNSSSSSASRRRTLSYSSSSSHCRRFREATGDKII